MPGLDAKTYEVRLAAGAAFPSITVPAVGGGEISPSDLPGWRIIVVYRGRHCPLCKGYLGKLQALRDDFAGAGIWVAAISADSREKAEADVAEQGWSFPVGYDLSLDQMRRLGLYVSDPISAKETDRPFAEPGVFVINPDGAVQILDVSNAPFARPDLQALLGGLQFVQARGYPVRGRA